MKKILFFVAVTLTVIIGCKKEKEAESVEAPLAAPEKINCDTNTLIIELKKRMNTQTYSQVLAWLKFKAKDICNGSNGELIECMEYFHKFPNQAAFTAAAQSHPENSATIIPYIKKWEDVQTYLTTIDCYDDYVGFNFTTNGVNFKKVPIFTDTESNYSKPFLLGVGKKLNLKTGDEFRFSKALESGNLKVIFEIRRYITPTTFDSFYYNFSNKPPLYGKLLDRKP